MFALHLLVSYLAILLAVSATPLNDDGQVGASCTVTSYDQVANALKSCNDITIKGIQVPAGKTLELELKDGTKLKFSGEIKFGHTEWGGPLVRVKGKGVHVEGETGHRLNGQGELYWDGKGGQGTKKPVFFRIQTSGGSTFSNINLLNCPERCTSIGSSDLTVSGWNVDCSLGDSKGGHNTDGFDISSSNNVVIKNTVVKNQDDCIAVNKGTNLHFSNLHCSGSHGLSLSVGMSKTNYDDNIVRNVTFSDCVVENSANAIHVKTHADGGPGEIADVTYKNIEMKGISNYGISVEEDYGDKGNPKGNVPIKNLRMENVHGSVNGKNGMNVYITCGSNGCSNWNWSEVKITGGKKGSKCNFKPSGYSC